MENGYYFFYKNIVDFENMGGGGSMLAWSVISRFFDVNFDVIRDFLFFQREFLRESWIDFPTWSWFWETIMRDSWIWESHVNVIPTTNYTGHVIEIQRFCDSDKISLVLLFLSISLYLVFPLFMTIRSWVRVKAEIKENKI